MIIDRNRIAGLESYFRNPRDGSVNLGGGQPATARSARLRKGQQHEISGIHLVVEADCLDDLVSARKPLETNRPLFSVAVQKEMFPRLFADPYRNRVYNIAGFGDFQKGEFENCQAMEVDGVPTLVSLGGGVVRWKSAVYPIPVPATFGAASWELAASTRAPEDSFHYSLTLNTWPSGHGTASAPSSVVLAAGASPGAARVRLPAGDGTPMAADVGFLEVAFEAEVRSDASLYERHALLPNASIGRPLLRAVNLLEPITSIYTIHSLGELMSLSSEYQLFETPGRPLGKMTATMDLAATLVFSDNSPQAGGAGSHSSAYEFVEVAVHHPGFKYFEARMAAEALTMASPQR